VRQARTHNRAGPVSIFLLIADANYLIPAREVEVPDAPPPLGELVGNFTWFEPDSGALVRTLRHVYENREEAAQRGREAAKMVRQEYP
jgi:hypothetical protein